jgi:hypothetical protein
LAKGNGGKGKGYKDGACKYMHVRLDENFGMKS